MKKSYTCPACHAVQRIDAFDWGPQDEPVDCLECGAEFKAEEWTCRECGTLEVTFREIRCPKCAAEMYPIKLLEFVKEYIG
jgi:predicted Zn finger-like uncharacterized protein